MNNITGGFITISLDFELFWGVRDVATIKSYGKNILGAREAIPKILNVFKCNQISATWATVGFVTFSNKRDLLAHLPDQFPEYVDQKLDPYRQLILIGESEESDPYHYGYSLLRRIQETPNMEIGSHSFSHFYCLEPRKNIGAYLADLRASIVSFQRLGVTAKSIVFCRNQYDAWHLKQAAAAGFEVFRGNERGDIYEPRGSSQLRWHHRAGRLIDAYVDITGSNRSIPQIDKSGMINVASSRFLRPWNHIPLEDLRMKRILDGMEVAAATNSGYHLWWHPHNFGKNLDQNMEVLSKIICHFLRLQDKYGMQSFSMDEAARKLRGL